VFSSRRIQRRLVEDVAFRVLAAGNQPDFRTIADFRKRHLAPLQGFFEQVLRLARALEAIQLTDPESRIMKGPTASCRRTTCKVR
jgi:transposase